MRKRKNSIPDTEMTVPAVDDLGVYVDYVEFDPLLNFIPDSDRDLDNFNTMPPKMIKEP